jgi:pheromone a factor receptor
VPTLLFIFWCFITVTPMAINSIIWYDGVSPRGLVWCDVSLCPFSSSPCAELVSQIVTKLRIGGDVGISASVLCITRQLESIAAARTASFSAGDRRRRRLVEFAIGLGMPTLVMILHTVVQGHRYDILERVGCIPSTYWSLPAIFLVVIWPLILNVVAAVYASE